MRALGLGFHETAYFETLVALQKIGLLRVIEGDRYTLDHAYTKVSDRKSSLAIMKSFLRDHLELSNAEAPEQLVQLNFQLFPLPA